MRPKTISAYFRGPGTLIRDILRQEGITGMFRGLVPTFAREVPGYFFFFGGYEISRHALTPKGKTKDEIDKYYDPHCSLSGTAVWNGSCMVQEREIWVPFISNLGITSTFQASSRPGFAVALAASHCGSPSSQRTL